MNSNDKKTVDTLGYESVIKAALPAETIIRHIEAMGPNTHGWEICPKPGHLIVFKVDKSIDLKIEIDRYEFNHQTKETLTAKMFKGNLPPDGDYNPDLPFLHQLLKSYTLIGVLVAL